LLGCNIQFLGRYLQVYKDDRYPVGSWNKVFHNIKGKFISRTYGNNLPLSSGHSNNWVESLNIVTYIQSFMGDCLIFDKSILGNNMIKIDLGLILILSGKFQKLLQFFAVLRKLPPLTDKLK
jgi:hypothetical protein